jgi:hypothetical protein
MNLRRTFFAATGLFFLVFSGAALSASSASVEVDWSGFNITPLSLTGGTIPGTTLTNEITDLFAAAGTLVEQQDVSDWSTAFSVSADSGVTGQANSEVNSNNKLIASSQSLESPAFADFSRSGTYTVSGGGLLLFEIPYMLEVSISGESSDFAEAFVELIIGREDQSGNGNDLFTANSISFLSGDVDGSARKSKNRKLTLALLVENGDELSFEAYGSSVTNASVVPIPAAFWLLSTALIGMAGFSRRT